MILQCFPAIFMKFFSVFLPYNLVSIRKDRGTLPHTLKNLEGSALKLPQGGKSPLTTFGKCTSCICKHKYKIKQKNRSYIGNPISTSGLYCNSYLLHRNACSCAIRVKRHDAPWRSSLLPAAMLLDNYKAEPHGSAKWCRKTACSYWLSNIQAVSCIDLKFVLANVCTYVCHNGSRAECPCGGIGGKAPKVFRSLGLSVFQSFKPSPLLRHDHAVLDIKKIVTMDVLLDRILNSRAGEKGLQPLHAPQKKPLPPLFHLRKNIVQQ